MLWIVGRWQVALRVAFGLCVVFLGIYLAALAGLIPNIGNRVVLGLPVLVALFGIVIGAIFLRKRKRSVVVVSSPALAIFTVILGAILIAPYLFIFLFYALFSIWIIGMSGR